MSFFEKACQEYVLRVLTFNGMAITIGIIGSLSSIIPILCDLNVLIKQKISFSVFIGYLYFSFIVYLILIKVSTVASSPTSI
jgi:hypothetical protein